MPQRVIAGPLVSVLRELRRRTFYRRCGAYGGPWPEVTGAGARVAFWPDSGGTWLGPFRRLSRRRLGGSALAAETRVSEGGCGFVAILLSPAGCRLGRLGADAGGQASWGSPGPLGDGHPPLPIDLPRWRRLASVIPHRLGWQRSAGGCRDLHPCLARQLPGSAELALARESLRPGTRGRDLVLLTAAAESFLDALRIGGSDALVDRQRLP